MALGAVSQRLQDAAAGVGRYLIPTEDIVDLGYPGVLALNISWKAVGVPRGQDILAVADFLAQSDVLGSSAAKYVDCSVEVRIGTAGSTDLYASADVFDEPDVYRGVIAWGAWQKFQPGNYPGRFAEFRIALASTNPQTTAYLLAFQMQAAVDTRIDHYQNLSVPAAGLTIAFQPDGAAAPAPFNGGPNGAALPYVNITAAGPQPGDLLQYSNLTLGSVTLSVTNGGTPVARGGINVDVQGY